MTPAIIGMFVLVLVGAFIGVVTAYRFTRDSSLKHGIVGFIAALGFIGVGTFGPGFLSDLGDFVVVALENPSPENLEKIVQKVDDGSMPPELARSLLVRYSAEDVPGFEEKLTQAATRTQDPEKKRVFEWCLEYEQKQQDLRAELARPEIQERLSAEAKAALRQPIRPTIRDVRPEGLRLDERHIERLRPDG